MAAITYGAHAPIETVKREAFAPRPAATKPGFWRRFSDAIVEARMRQAMNEIQRHQHLLPLELEMAGDKITGKNEHDLPFSR